MRDFSEYMHAQETTARRKAEDEAAGLRLELARIRERLAEIKSQYEPLAGIIMADMDYRGKMHAAAFYVVVGRMPEGGIFSEKEAKKP